MKRTQGQEQSNNDHHVLSSHDQTKRRKLSYDVIPHEIQRTIFSFFDWHALVHTVSMLNSHMNTFVNSNEEVWIHQYNSHFASSSLQYHHKLYDDSIFQEKRDDESSLTYHMALDKYMDTKERMKIAYNLSVTNIHNTNDDGVTTASISMPVFPDNLIYYLFRRRMDMDKYWKKKKMISFTAVPSAQYRQEFYEGNNIVELLETMKKKDEGIEIPREIPVEYGSIWYWKDGRDFTPYEYADSQKIEREYIVSNGQGTVNLGHYQIDFIKMKQINQKDKRKTRNVRREGYTLEMLDALIKRYDHIDQKLSDVQDLILGQNGQFESGYAYLSQWLVDNQSAFPKIESIRIPDDSVEELQFFSIGDVTTALQNLHSVKHWMLSGSHFVISPFSNHNLMSIILISGCLSPDAIKNLCMSKLTSLHHLELWIGEMNNWSDDTLAHLLSREENGQFPMLQYLGLRNGERISILCEAIVQSSIAKRVRVIDLSLGLLNNTGANQLLKLGGPEFCSLDILDIHHNSISDSSITQKLQNELKCFVDARFPNMNYIAMMPH